MLCKTKLQVFDPRQLSLTHLAETQDLKKQVSHLEVANAALQESIKEKVCILSSCASVKLMSRAGSLKLPNSISWRRKAGQTNLSGCLVTKFCW